MQAYMLAGPRCKHGFPVSQETALTRAKASGLIPSRKPVHFGAVAAIRMLGGWSREDWRRATPTGPRSRAGLDLWSHQITMRSISSTVTVSAVRS